MDWLPSPLHIADPLPEVPCLSDIDYDHDSDWENYPQRQNYEPRTLPEWQNFFQDLPAGFEAFIERWLFWGVLEHTLGGISLSVNDYSCVANGRRVIRISKAFLLVPKGRSLHHHQTSCRIHDKLRMQYNCAGQPRLSPDLNGINELDLHTYMANHGNQVPLHIYFRFAAEEFMDPRSAALVQAINLIYELSEPFLGFKPVIEDVPLAAYRRLQMTSVVRKGSDADQLAVERLLELGWCPWEVRMLCEKLNSQTIFYMSQLLRPNATKDHMAHDSGPIHALSVSSLDGSSHAECTSDHCRYTIVEQSTYKTAHAAGCHGCRTIAVDSMVLESTLRSKQIPLVSIRDWDEASDVVKLVPQQEEPRKRKKYVAFSHTWSDGLGNLQGNALPSCQLERLRKLLDVYNEKHKPEDQTEHYWLDTLCVPPDSLGDPDLQKLATHKLREAYEEASLVMVLDGWLVATPTTGMRASEKLLRATCSPWTRRLWTLQEGVLARNRCFYFVFNHSELFDADDAYERLLTCGWSRRFYGIMCQMLARYEELRCKSLSNQDDSSHAYDRFHNLARCLKFRATSVSSDEALCIAVLLKLDLVKVAMASAVGRMHKVWDQVVEVPAMLLFWDLPRFSDEPRWWDHVGHLWAPTTFLHSRGTLDLLFPTSLESRKLAQVTRRGVRMRARGWIFERPPGMLIHRGEGILRPCLHVSRNDEHISIFSSLLAVTSCTAARLGKSWTGLSLEDALGISLRRRERAHERFHGKCAIVMPDEQQRLSSKGSTPALLVILQRGCREGCCMWQDADGHFVAHLIEGVMLRRVTAQSVNVADNGELSFTCLLGCETWDAMPIEEYPEDQGLLID